MVPRSDEQNQIIRDERRDQILNHAMVLFAKRGYAATKVSDVALSASMSQGLVYHYFTSKEEMFVAVVEQTIELSNNAMKGIYSMPAEPVDKMKIMAERNLCYEDPNGYALRWLIMFQTGLTDSVPRQARELLKGKFAAIEYTKMIIEEGQKKGQFSKEKDAGSLATAYWSFMQGLIFFHALNSVNWGEKIPMPDLETVMKILK